MCTSVGSANNVNKLSLVGMQLPEKYIKENFAVSSEGISSGVRLETSLVIPHEGSSLETSKFSLYFSGRCISTNESL